ncbi:hypothetical protein FQN55_000077 [Onygenales sp. PD_40]|nr:hypothetical protein FQN55_000077 [Onygenales sp. PD_40]
MPTKMTSQKNIQPRVPLSRSSNPSRNDDSGSGGRVLSSPPKSSYSSAKMQAAKTNRRVQPAEASSRRTQKTPSSGSLTDGQTSSGSFPFRSNTEQRAVASTRRRQSIRENGSFMTRHGDPTKRPNTSAPQTHSANPSLQSTSSHGYSGNTNSRLSFGSLALSDATKDENQTPPDGSEFLAPISFDDFHNSIMSKEPSLSHFPIPRPGGSGHDANSTVPKSTSRWSSEQPPQDGRGPRNTLVRRQSNASRSTVGSGATANNMAPPNAPTGPRARRLSHVPPPSSHVVTTRPPRKSIGPGSLVSDNGDRGAPRRRPSLSTRKNPADANRQPHSNFSQPIPQPNSEMTIPDTSAFLNTPRYQKARSLQPPTRTPRDSLIIPSAASDYSRSSSNNAIRTPNKSAPSRTTTPSSSSKRTSVMPPHAHGLGARTISPTDARRMKRMSLMPQPPPMPHTPPTQPQELVLPRPRSSAQSPSMIPRKSVTPSSSRTTPDPHRKSYSSGISLSSNTSYNSVRNSNGSLQPRPSQNVSSSRLPTPKPRVENTTSTDEEEVPPVPAIPKAYESPKGEGEPSQFTARKSSLPLEVGVKGGSKLDSDPNDTPTIARTKDYPDFSRPISHRPDFKNRPTSTIARKNLQPLKLPPLNLLPLSIPMATKIDSLREKNGQDSTLRPATTPPPRQTTAKTPSTPMTASKASFFEHGMQDHEIPSSVQGRSNSSHFALRTDPIKFRAQNSSSALEPLDIPPNNRTVSPYVSSSLPKASAEFAHIRPQVAGEYSRSNVGRLTGPRPQTQFATFSPQIETPSVATISNADTESESSAPSSTRLQPAADRHRNISSKTNAAKGSNDAVKFGSMPPPKLPASATWNNISTRASPNSKPTYLHSRRKASTSSITNGLAPRNQSISSDTSIVNPSPSTDAGDTDSQPSRSASSILSPVHKLLGSSKSSTSKLRPQDQNLDRDDLFAEEEMRKLGSKRKDFESAAKELDELRRRASPKERVSPAQALKMATLNIFEKGEIIDFKDIYFCGTHKAKKHVGDLNAQTANFGYDDDRGDYNIVLGDHLAYRYEIVDVLGKGSFGQVVRCVDHKTGVLVAVKIIRNKKRFHQQALVEVNILQKLKEWDPHRRHSVVNFTQSFYFRGHLCISTELLGMNLYEFIKAHDFRGFSLKIIRRFTKQLLSTLVLLRSHKVIHCDLKPENVLLAHPMHSEIKVIDFGSSCFENEKVYTYIQSRFYRSPEVILGMSYGMPIDMWSVGCILAELYTGYPIFPGENEQEQLACIMEVFGPPEKHLIEKSTRRKLFFDSLGKPRLTVSSKGRRRRPSSKDLRQVLKCDDEAFLDFITRCLRWDPARRLNPNDALNHEFITGVKLHPRSRSQLPPLHSPASKRMASGPASSTIRPLPDPPTLGAKSSARSRDIAGHSPVKPTGPKRNSATTSTVTSTTSNVTKRTSNGNPMSGSALPRVTRATSGKADLATAAAATSLVS